VLSYRIVRRTLVPGISVGWGVCVGVAFVGGGDVVGDGSVAAHALDSIRIIVKLTIMGFKIFIFSHPFKMRGFG
jgi:hypothetical protein